MTRLSERDVRGALELIYDAGALTCPALSAGVPRAARVVDSRRRHRRLPRGCDRSSLSYFMTRRRRRQTEWYSTVWKPLGIDDSLRVWLPAPAGRARVINLERRGRNFTERERSLLEFIRPALIKMHLAASSRCRRNGPESQLLTRRETEILGWIARGKTSREIAAILVISPYTVRKHVEHILEKLEVSTRSAAVARAFPTLSREG
jgi:DNA-binding CsgD family transcriptional regulator